MSTYETIFALYAAVTLPLFVLDFYRSGFKKAIKCVFWPIALALKLLALLVLGVGYIILISVILQNIKNPETREDTFEKLHKILERTKERYTNKD